MQVAALVSVPAASAARRLPYRSPYSLDSTWRIKQTIGLALDRFVGVVWCLIMIAGFNKDARYAQRFPVIALRWADELCARLQVGHYQHHSRRAGRVLPPCPVVELPFGAVKARLYVSRFAGERASEKQQSV